MAEYPGRRECALAGAMAFWWAYGIGVAAAYGLIPPVCWLGILCCVSRLESR